MYLYTCHDLDFNIVKDVSDLKKSYWYGRDIISMTKAYNYLFNLIGTRQIIWCYGEASSCIYKSKKPYRIWHLDVPKKDVIAIDSTIWDYVINGWRYASDELFDEVTRYCNGDVDKASDMIDKMFKNTKQTYKQLIKPLKDAVRDTDQFLIPSPVKKHWVLHKGIFTAG